MATPALAGMQLPTYQVRFKKAHAAPLFLPKVPPMSDTLILRNAALATGSTVVDLPAQGWVVLQHGVCCRGDADVYAAASTIDIVGMADASAFKAHFLLLP